MLAIDGFVWGCVMHIWFNNSNNITASQFKKAYADYISRDVYMSDGMDGVYLYGSINRDIGKNSGLTLAIVTSEKDMFSESQRKVIAENIKNISSSIEYSICFIDGRIFIRSSIDMKKIYNQSLTNILKILQSKVINLVETYMKCIAI